jgi:hypothetical protein
MHISDLNKVQEVSQRLTGLQAALGSVADHGVTVVTPLGDVTSKLSAGTRTAIQRLVAADLSDQVDVTEEELAELGVTTGEPDVQIHIVLG